MSKLGIAVAALLAAAAMAVAYTAWQSLADVEMSTAGYVAMILGGVATILVGVGLMALLFWSCLLYTSPSPRDGLLSRMPSSA